jgi:predicted nucleotidyltransferase
VEIDYSSNELGAVLVGILQGNGNYVERVLTALPLRSSLEHEELRHIVGRSISKRLYRHYQGFARGQLEEFDSADVPTAKKLLYVLRTALTGVHVLRTGRVVADVGQLLDRYGFGEATELIERKRAGERVILDEPLKSKWRGQVERAFSALDEALQASSLPDEPPNRDEFEAWLQQIRRRHWVSPHEAHDSPIASWFAAGTNPQGYEIGLDTATLFRGRPSGRLRSRQPGTEEFATLMQREPAGRFAGCRIRLRGTVKTAQVSGWAGLWMRIDGPPRTDGSLNILTMDNMGERPIRGDNDWQPYEVVLEVAPRAREISFGLLLHGDGEAWIGDASLDIVT